MTWRHNYAFCFGLTSVVLSACSVPDLRVVETSDEGTTAAPPFVPREGPRVSAADGGMEDAAAEVEQAGARAAIGSSAAGEGVGVGGAASGGAPVEGAAGNAGSGGEVAGGSGGASGSSSGDGGAAMRVDAGPPDEPAPTEPNPCLLWVSSSSRQRVPDDAVMGGLETTAGIDSRQYVCRVQPPDLDYAVPGKAIYGNGCLVAYRIAGAMKAHLQQNGSPYELLTAGPGCSFSWQSADNSSVPSGALDLSGPPGHTLYACRGDFDGPLSSGVQVGGVQGASDTPPRYECWFESYTSPMQPLNPTTFEVLTLN